MFLQISAIFLTMLVHAAVANGENLGKERLVDRFTDEKLVAILGDEGYGRIERLDPGYISYLSAGSKLLLRNDLDGNLRLIYAVRGDQFTLQMINAWNRKMRFSRAFLDPEASVAVLESDLPSRGGFTEEGVREFIRVFNISWLGFQHHISESRLSEKSRFQASF